MRIRLKNRKHKQYLINIRNRRPYQLITPRKYLDHIPRLLTLIKHFYLYIISHKRPDLLSSESPFCLTFINTGSYYMYIVESGNTLYNLSLHKLSCLASRLFLVSAAANACIPFERTIL